MDIARTKHELECICKKTQININKNEIEDFNVVYNAIWQEQKEDQLV